MGRRTWLAAAGLVLAASNAWADEKPCQLLAIGELTVSTDGSDVVTDAEINGRPVRLAVDTGSDATMLYRDAAERLGLNFRHLTGAQSYGVGGATNIYSTRVKELRIGNMIERDSDLIATGRSTGPAQGAIGERFLTQADVEFDLPHGKIRFFKPHGCAGDQVVYWGDAYAVAPIQPTPNYQILVQVRVNGALLTAQLDTGAGVSVLTPAGAAKAGVSRHSPGVTRVGNVQGTGQETIRAYVDTFPSFSFGEETIKNARLWIADLFHYDKQYGTADLIPKTVVDEPDMLLGADFFRSHRVYVSGQQHKVYVTYAGGPVFQTNAAPRTPQAVTNGPAANAGPN
ncbi:MAG TPA: retropepsin-like aspartic protease [Caulobacteraceae bacterium]|jgi:predicted aspartyl protease